MKNISYFRRYTNFFGRNGKNAPKIAMDALDEFGKWIEEIEKWQAPILMDKNLPDWYKQVLHSSYYLNLPILFTPPFPPSPSLSSHRLFSMSYIIWWKGVLYGWGRKYQKREKKEKNRWKKHLLWLRRRHSRQLGNLGNFNFLVLFHFILFLVSSYYYYYRVFFSFFANYYQTATSKA